ncbi:hypothetical protein [Microcoleus vaginatus]|uniref:hypothetical protein n=1 Tax=Microcoleus vaginatus TaxID=119532 RepID=UPI0040407B22
MDKARPPRPTINFIDKYCASSINWFSDVRIFEVLEQLHLGMLSPIERKTLPGIAEVVRLANEQSLYHFSTKSPRIKSTLNKSKAIFYFTRLKKHKNICNF